jgi:hypothetical protein
VSARRPDLGEIDDRAEERLLSGRPVDDEPALSAFVGDLLASAQDVPTPSAALAELLDKGVDPATAPVPVPADVTTAALPVVPGRRRFLPLWSRAALAGAAAMVLLLSAAAIGALPGTAQNAVADVVGWVTPLDLPHEDERTPLPAVSPTPSASPEVEAGDDKGGAGEVESGDDSGGHGSDDSGSGPGSGSDDSSGADDSSGSSNSGSDDSSGSGSGSSSSGSGSDDSSGSGSGDSPGSDSSGSGSSGSDSSGSGSGGSDDSSGSGSGSSGSGSSGSGSDDSKASPSPTPSPTKTSGSDDH